MYREIPSQYGIELSAPQPEDYGQVLLNLDRIESQSEETHIRDENNIELDLSDSPGEFDIGAISTNANVEVEKVNKTESERDTNEDTVISKSAAEQKEDTINSDETSGVSTLVIDPESSEVEGVGRLEIFASKMKNLKVKDLTNLDGEVLAQERTYVNEKGKKVTERRDIKQKVKRGGTLGPKRFSRWRKN